eukprot:CAMPEP_0170135078 /NCGR_PEP_ID=MMETSP0033_2-20121228/2296_1 /TAXON_ID=195969 /ORGANISM="Dolichomastix tenuilepis, Strain CCMP3274" /LENGTH=1042 /DNA_ID=CAMNT_0010370673 /DNA_START=45 /DNA_END=3173 /DNA_ORIENTATION=+
MGSGVDLEQLTALSASTSERAQALAAAGGVEGVAAELGTSIALGLPASEDVVREKRELYGDNTVREREPDSLLQVLWANTNQLIIWLLLAAAGVSLLVDYFQGGTAWYSEGVALIITVTLVVTFSSAFEFVRERQFLSLLERANAFKVMVLRDGQYSALSATEVVVGDVVRLEAGEVVAGDGILVAGRVDMDESTLTGESHTVSKQSAGEALYRGTAVESGQGQMLVLRVGEATEMGLVLRLVDEAEDVRSGLETKLEDLAQHILIISAYASGAFMLVLITEYCIWKYVFTDADPGDATGETSTDILDLVLDAVVLLVVGIPEGLPVAVALSLVIGSSKMEAEKMLVKKPRKAETCGNITTLCTDKTGTLTTGEMRVVSLRIGGGAPVEAGQLAAMADRVGKPASTSESAHVLDVLLNVAVNTTAVVSTAAHHIAHAQEYGSSTERGLLRWLEETTGADFNTLRQTVGEPIWRAPFSSDRKLCSTIVRCPHRAGSPAMLVCKGALEVLLPLCTLRAARGRGAEGEGEGEGEEDAATMPLTGEERERLLDENKKAGTLRVIALAVRVFPEGWSVDGAPQADPQRAGLPAGSPEAGELTFLGTMTLQDPLRPDAAVAVAQCKGAGVDVKMVTGDAAATATAVARECGILAPGQEGWPYVATGEEFRRAVAVATTSGRGSSEGEGEDVKGARVGLALDQEAMDKIWPHLKVLARSTPTDKVLLVKGIMDSELYRSSARPAFLHPAKQIVGVTGDGANDIAALKQAHVGMAMGAGQQMAIQEADVVLMDSAFHSCVTGIKWGRNIYAAVLKFLQFQVTVSCVAALFLTGEAMVLMDTTPITITQALWLNLVQDTLGGLALASDVASPELLQQTPHLEGKFIIEPIIMFNICGQALYQAAVLFFCDGFSSILFTNSGDPFLRDQTVSFTLITLLTLANEFCVRGSAVGKYNNFSGITQNPYFVVVMLVQNVVQVLLVTFGGAAVGCQPLMPRDWAVCYFFALTVFPVQAAITFAWKSFAVPLGWDKAPRAVAKTEEVDERTPLQQAV